MHKSFAAIFLALAIPCAQAIAPSQQGTQSRSIARGDVVPVSVSLEPVVEVSAMALTQKYTPLMAYLGHATGATFRVAYSHDLTQALSAARLAKYPIVIGPANVVGTALRHGYEPVAAFPGVQKMLLLASRPSGILSFDDSKGKRLGLPPTDSTGGYLARGEFTLRGIRPKSYFGSVRHFNLHESALYNLQMGVVDAAVVDSAYAQAWMEKNGGMAQVLLTTQGVPATGIAIDTHLAAEFRKEIRDALLKPDAQGLSALATLGVAGLRAITRDDYIYAGGLGYFTPDRVSGFKIVGADGVRELVKQGAILYDVRSQRDWSDNHILGAHWMPYEEASRREVEFDRTADHFAVDKLPQDRRAKLIFQCNGDESWTSYKAAVVAASAGYANVHWFRGGLPEWRAKGLPME